MRRYDKELIKKGEQPSRVDTFMWNEQYRSDVEARNKRTLESTKFWVKPEPIVEEVKVHAFYHNHPFSVFIKNHPYLFNRYVVIIYGCASKSILIHENTDLWNAYRHALDWVSMKHSEKTKLGYMRTRY